MTNVVRGWVIAVALPAMAAVPAVAQEPPFHATRGYVSPFGGTVWDGDTTGNLIFEGGARVAPHLLRLATSGGSTICARPDAVHQFPDGRAAGRHRAGGWHRRDDGARDVRRAVGYRYSRIAADSTLSADALGTSTMTLGFGYRFQAKAGYSASMQIGGRPR
jgi:hypothetical protein